jgi:hypothetical protein
MTRILVPAVTALAVVAVLVGVASYNRSRAPLTALALTEREVRLAHDYDEKGQERELQLWIAFEPRSDRFDARNWLTEDRLRALGFALDWPAGAPEAEDRYQRQPARLAWIALEYDGPAAKEIARQQQMGPSHGMMRGAWLDSSRLVPVDAAREVEPLLRRYPTGHLIVRGVIDLVFTPAEQGGPMVHGIIRQLTPSTVTVPLELRPLLEDLARSLRRDPPAEGVRILEPRYQVDVAIGPLGLPYVTSVRRTDTR